MQIESRTDTALQGKILIAIPSPESQVSTTLFIAMPNKREKAELMVQKLTEIGIKKILFRPAERSVIKSWNDNKYQRLLRIAKEAVEQSR